MQSRRDQIHSYQFFMHRVISGLVARESDPAELPFRRLGGAALGGVMVAVLALAAVGVYGLIVGGGATSWRKGSFVIVEKESGTRYVYRDGRLYPVVNFTSGRLVLGSAAAAKLVSAKSLAGVPRGPVLGIAGAPEGLPDQKRLLSGAWTLCSRMVSDGQGGQVATSALGVGRMPEGGIELTIEQALLVRLADADEPALYLVWNNHRFVLQNADPVLRALGVSAGRALPVASAWLDALPRGSPIGTIQVDGRGAPTTAFGVSREERTGQVIEAPAGTYYLVRSDSLQPVTALQKDILLADPATAAAYPDGQPRVVSVSTALLANATVDGSAERVVSGPPEHRPELVSPMPNDFRDGAVCGSFQPDTFLPAIRVGGRLSGPGMDTPRRTTEGRVLADVVYVEPGWAVLAEALSSPDAQAGSLHLVTDQGVRYGLANRDVAGMLGYDPGRAVRLPASLLDRTPRGPALDPEAAKQPV